MAAAAALADVNKCLLWIGFMVQGHQDSIIEEAGFMSLSSFIDGSKMDIRDMSESYMKRSGANCIIFSLCHTKLLVGIMHWAQDNDRCSREPTFDDIPDGDTFKLPRSIERANLHKVDQDQVDTISKVADPGKFKDE